MATLTKEDYCGRDTCVALKELGYKVPTSAFYVPNNETLCFVSYPYRGGSVIDCFYSHNSLREDVMTHDFIDAPTMWEAQKFLREEKDAHIVVKPTKGKYYCTILFKDKNPMLLTHENIVVRYFDSYEEALSEGIKEVVEILKRWHQRTRNPKQISVTFGEEMVNSLKEWEN